VVVVDVFSFSTSVDVAVGRGCTVYPARWNDDRAANLAQRLGAVLAVGRSAMSPDHPYSLSPASLTHIPSGTRLVLPSPNGAMICAESADSGAFVFAGCLRNAAAVARAAMDHSARVGVVAAGELWPDGALRPALEDMIGAGMILAELGGHPSPEAEVAIAAADQLTSGALSDCVSARELVGMGFEGDVALAVMLNLSDATPLLRDGAFVDSKVTN
jgi:2-phosphosulfolactate phosphatase